MKMISRKRFRKRIALFLLLVLLVPFVSILPAVHVSAAGGSPFPFDYPSTDTFYPVDFVIRLFNVDSAYYLRVRADTGQKIASWQGIADMYSISILPDPFSKYTYYDVSGNVVSDPFAGTGSENLELVRSESDDHLTDVFGVVIASNADLYTYAYAGRDALDTSEVYFYANYISLAVTPTPTPIAKPEIKGWYDYPELPSNFSADTLCILRAHNVGVNEGKLIGIGFSPSGSVFNYPIFYKDRSNWNYRSQALFDNGITINTWSNGQWNFSVFTVNYDEVTDTYSVGNSLKSGWSNPGDSWYVSSNLDWRGETISSWSLVSGNSLIVTGQQAGEYSTGSWFEILFTNHNKIPGVSSNPNVSATPSPTSSPTPTPYSPVYVSPTPSPVPSPGVTITPTQGPSETSVKELRGWKGALQRILQSVFVGNTEAIEGYFKDAVGGYQIVQNPFKQIVDSIYVDGSDQENFDPFENQQVDFIFDVHDQNGNVVGGEHTANWRLTILPKTFWTWLKSYSNYFEIVFYMVDASFLGATMKRWLTKQNDEGSETKEGGSG